MTGGGLRLSVIIPSLDEGAGINTLLDSLQSLREAGHELILVDGGSRDDTRERARPWCDRVILTAPGRATQMNAGAEVASGNLFWFLHADSTVAEELPDRMLDGLRNCTCRWGRFDIRLSGSHPGLRLVEFMMNQRSRLTGVATGDQGIFVYAESFREVGGFPQIPLMEDVAISRQLKRISPPLCISDRLVTSSRRWERNGLLRTILLMWRLRLAYFLGVDPERLARHYR